MKNAVKLLTFGFIVLIMVSCVKSPSNAIYIKLDMSKEHDAGRFKPETGDKISITGNFNNWNPDSIFLLDKNGDWVYTVELQQDISPDTLIFKFIQKAGDGRALANQGWESISNRKHSVYQLKKDTPSFVFNEGNGIGKIVNITFTVGTATQKVLGFFKPEEGDKIIVTGNFYNWDEEGILMEDKDGDDIYTVTVPVSHRPGVPIEYKFRIIAQRDVLLPNSGWENIINRRHYVERDGMKTTYAEFNDLRRVVRFIINTEQWENDKKFNPLKGNILQVKLLLDGKESLTEALIRVRKHVYETAVVIALTVQEIKWQLVKNMEEELTELKAVEVGLKGKVIFYNG